VGSTSRSTERAEQVVTEPGGASRRRRVTGPAEERRGDEEYAAALTGGDDNSQSKATFISPMTKTGGPFICPTGGTFNASYLLMSNGYTLALH
jgi:hypothetical protein